ncbi:MAG: HAD family hydrolase [Candidatus Methylomirabilales bacterium]
MIKAIAFDLGGVLFAEGNSVAAEKLSRERGYQKDRILGLFMSPKSIALRKGRIADAEFWAWAKQQLPDHYDVHLIQREWYDAYVKDEDIFRLIARLQGKYTIVAFSGNIKSRVDFLEEKYRFRRLFDVEVYSFMHGLSKMDKDFAKVMVRKSGVKAGEIVYVDDNEKHASHAKELGVTVVIYAGGGIQQLQKELENAGVEP